MEDFTKIVNWDNLLREAKTFQNNKPFKFAFVGEFFVRDFYEKLYATYPKIDESWHHISSYDKNHFSKKWGKTEITQIVQEGDDPSRSDDWNKLKRYCESKEFADNFSKFSGIKVTKLKHFHFIAMKKGGFQLPHIHNVGLSTLIIMVYFSKGWKQGEPGGTYVASKEDEASILFEPYNLDNTMVIFHDSPYSVHGARYMEKDTERKALQITLEYYSPETGWSGGDPDVISKKRTENLVEL